MPLPRFLTNTKVFSESSESSVKKISYNYTQHTSVLSMRRVAVDVLAEYAIMNCDPVDTVNREQPFPFRFEKDLHNPNG